MELRCGVDLLEIARMEQSLQNPRFVERVFGAAELAQYGGRLPAPSLAAAFCAKEAFSKALGTGIREFALHEVELLHQPSGKPYLRLTGRALELAEREGLSFDVSLSHTEELATAYVIAWGGRTGSATDSRPCLTK